MSDPQVQKLEAVKRALAIANRVNSSALEAAKKAPKMSLAGGKRRRKRSASPKTSTKKTHRRKRSPKRK